MQTGIATLGTSESGAWGSFATLPVDREVSIRARATVECTRTRGPTGWVHHQGHRFRGGGCQHAQRMAGAGHGREHTLRVTSRRWDSRARASRRTLRARHADCAARVHRRSADVDEHQSPPSITQACPPRVEVGYRPRRVSRPRPGRDSCRWRARSSSDQYSAAPPARRRRRRVRQRGRIARASAGALWCVRRSRFRAFTSGGYGQVARRQPQVRPGRSIHGASSGPTTHCDPHASRADAVPAGDGTGSGGTQGSTRAHTLRQ